LHKFFCTSFEHVIVRPLSTVGYTSIASVIHCRQWSDSDYYNSWPFARGPEGSVTQLRECSVLRKTPLFSERKYTLLGSKVAGQGVVATKAYRRKRTIEPRQW